MTQFGHEFRAGAVSNVLSSTNESSRATHLAATIAWMHVLSSMTPTSVVSSRDTTGTFNALGSRARQFDLFWSSNVYSTFTIAVAALEMKAEMSVHACLALVSAGCRPCCPRRRQLRASTYAPWHHRRRHCLMAWTWLPRIWPKAGRPCRGGESVVAVQREVVNVISRSVAGVRSSRTRLLVKHGTATANDDKSD